MTDFSTSTSADPSLLQSLKSHLDGLKRTQQGVILYHQIQRGLQKYAREDGRIELVFVTFLHALLGKYATNPACDPSTRVKARFIQQRLTLYLPKSIPVTSPAPTARITESIAVNQEFGELLEHERETLKQVDNPLAGFSDLKQILVKGLNELIEEREALIDKLSGASDYLKAVETDREHLRRELSHARQHGLADELTGLPKREVFVKQLEAEIGRVKRYGFALAVAVVDVDNLDSVNKRHGRLTGDAVLRCYAGEILAKFRAYDLVTRYGGDEFAVLFPNTQKDGAMHALEKARKTATGTFIRQNGISIPLPSFSSVLTPYAPGEPAAALLQRADQTLSQARLSGYNRMVVALPTA